MVGFGFKTNPAIMIDDSDHIFYLVQMGGHELGFVVEVINQFPSFFQNPICLLIEFSDFRDGRVNII